MRAVECPRLANSEPEKGYDDDDDDDDDLCICCSFDVYSKHRFRTEH